MSKLGGIRKDFLQMEAFRMILREVVKNYPEIATYDPNKDNETQVDLWKSKSAEQRGFDNAFKLITGISVGDMKNE